GESASIITESEAFDYLDAPIIRIDSDDVPVPYANILENAVLPNVEKIKAPKYNQVNNG
ncbi:alpha-ketoacid dehydrogenase subunit beta, partial [Streptococcus suis]